MKAKICLVYSLLLAGMTTGALTGCGSLPGDLVGDIFELKLKYAKNEGAVKASSLGGFLSADTKVDIQIIPNEGMRVKSITLNNTPLEVKNNFSITPSSGANELHVLFEKDLDENQYYLEISYDKDLGEVVCDSIKGTIEKNKTCELLLKPNSNCLVESVTVNDVESPVINNTVTFAPKAGVNKIFVKFVDQAIKKFNIEVIKPTNGDVVVNLDKTTGSLGDVVNFTIKTNSRFEVSNLYLNGVEIGNKVTSFVPTLEGLNKFEVKIKDKRYVPILERGKDFSGVIRTESTDFKENESPVDYVIDQIVKDFGKNDNLEFARYDLNGYFKYFNVYENVIVRYGIKKADIDGLYTFITNTQLFKDLISNKKLTTEQITDEILKISYQFITKDIKLDKFTGLFALGLLTYNFSTCGVSFGNKIGELYNLASEPGEVGKAARERLAGTLLDKNEIVKLIDTYATYAELIYRIGNNKVIPTVAEFERQVLTIKKIIKFFDNDKTNDQEITRFELTNLVKTISESINNNFLSKEGFINLIDTLYKNGDLISRHLYVFGNTNTYKNRIVKDTYSQVIKALFDHKNEAFYLAKLAGLFAKEIDENFVTDLMMIILNKETSLHKWAQFVVAIAKKYQVVKITYSGNQNAIEALNNSGALIAKLYVILNNGKLDATNFQAINTTLFFKKLDEFKSYTITSPEVDTVVVPYLESLIKEFPSIIREKQEFITYSKSHFLTNEKLDLRVTYNGIDVIKDCVVSGFDSTLEGYKVLKIQYKNITTYKHYVVSKTTNLLDNKNNVYTLKLNSDIEQIFYPFALGDGENLNWINIPSDKKCVLDNKTEGVKAGWFFHKDNYHFFTYIVK